MRNGILTVVALTMGGVALADTPPLQTQAQPVPQQVIEDLSELRQELGQSNSTPAEFAQAVQNLAERRVEVSSPWDSSGPAQAWAADGAPQPTQNLWGAGPSQRFTPPLGQVVPASNVPSPSPPQYHQPGQFIATNPYAPGPPPHHAKPGPRPPKVLLEDTAFDLERMAHELDKADLYGEADALREAASRLRQTARQHKKPDGRPHPPMADRPGPAPVEHPHAAERARRAIQDANDRVQQMERQLAEAQARLEQQAVETRRRMHQMEERARRALDEAERTHEERARREEAREERNWSRQRREEASEGRQRPQERRPDRSDRNSGDRSELPPRGVYGGPTDPPGAPTPALAESPGPYAD